MEIKVGDYVKTKYGISKVVEDEDIVLNDNGNRTIYVDKNGIPRENIFAYYVWSDDIIKSSSNIIDLIEVGDYVNCKKVTKINLNRQSDKRKRILCEDQHFDCLDEMYANEDIKSIVTKEQFESMEYKIER